MDGARLVRIEIDEDGDGTIDRWEHYGDDQPPAGSSIRNPPSALSRNQGRVQAALTRIDRAPNDDGKVTRSEDCEHGVLTRVEEDTNGDGQVDKWETFAGTTVETIALDTRGRGTPDRRLVYAPDGTLARIEVDPDGSGAFRVEHP